MLHNEHSKAAKELQRKITKLREENKDPSLPQKHAARVQTDSSSAASARPQSAPSPPPQARNRMSDSQQTVDESFMLLGQRVCDHSVFHAPPADLSWSQSEPSDAFNHFWKITEGMLEHLSQPVAFATAPLAPLVESPQKAGRRRDASSNSSDTDIEDPISRRLSRGISFVKAARSKMLTRHDSSANASDSDVAGPSTFPPRPQPTHAYDIGDEWDDDVRANDGGWHTYVIFRILISIVPVQMTIWQTRSALSRLRRSLNLRPSNRKTRFSKSSWRKRRSS